MSEKLPLEPPMAELLDRARQRLDSAAEALIEAVVDLKEALRRGELAIRVIRPTDIADISDKSENKNH